MKTPHLFSTLSATLVLAMGLSSPVALAEDKPVAEVNGTAISQASIDAYAEQRRQLRPGQVSQEQLLNEVIGKVLVYQDAVTNGIDKDPALLERLERLRREVIVAEALDAYAEANPVTDEEMEKVYN